MNYIRNPDTAFIPERRILKLLDHVHGDRLQQRHEATREYLDFVIRVKQCTEDGKICLVESGRDCDGVQYSGHTSTIEAKEGETMLQAVKREMALAYQNAEGPCHVYVASPSEAEFIEYSSRDLVMEAYEDGHAHSIHPHAY